ncbi:MAG: hypothetical protein OSB57_01930 [Planctomycetota bacterium]|nr:hypothetical protein [Planctomycetota bacterium]
MIELLGKLADDAPILVCFMVVVWYLVSTASKERILLLGEFRDSLKAIGDDCHDHAEDITARYLERDKERANMQKETNEILRHNTMVMARTERVLERGGG